MANKFWGKWALPGIRLVAATALVLLAACGSSSKYDEFIPTRIISIGDQLSYLGNGYDRYTVNNVVGVTAFENNWLLTLARLYQISSTNIKSKVSASDNRVEHLSGQILDIKLDPETASPMPYDMLVISAGLSDIIYWIDEVLRPGTTTTPAAAVQKAREAGVALQQFAMAQRSDYPHILILSAYNLKNSPYVRNATPNTAIVSYGGLSKLVDDMTSAFNTGVKSSTSDQPLSFPAGSGLRLLEIDGALLVANFANLGITSEGMSLGACSVSGSACTTSSANINYGQYFFADDKFPSPSVHFYVGSLAYSFLRGIKGW